MYDNYLNGSELTMFHNKVKVNLTYELTEILDDNPLFLVEEQTGNVFKVFPLFNCDLIESSNDKDRVLENKCIICINDEDTIINFVSNNEINDLKINYEITNKFNENIIYGVVYDSIINSPIRNVDLTLDLFNSSDVLKENINLITDKYGGFVAVFKEYTNTDKLRITAKIEDIVKTFQEDYYGV